MSTEERYIHHRHGACRVIGRQTRQVGEETRTYVELQSEATASGRVPLTLLLPEDELFEHVRHVVDRDEAERALAALADAAPSAIEDAETWRARVAKAEAATDRGDLVELARVLRDFWLRDRDEGLSASERRVADHVRDLVVGELAGALDSPLEATNELVEQRLGASADAA